MAENLLSSGFFKEGSPSYGLFTSLMGEAKEYGWLGFNLVDPADIAAIALLADCVYPLGKEGETFQSRVTRISQSLDVEENVARHRYLDRKTRVLAALSESYKIHSAHMVAIYSLAEAAKGKMVDGAIILSLDSSNRARHEVTETAFNSLAEFYFRTSSVELPAKDPIINLLVKKGYILGRGLISADGNQAVNRMIDFINANLIKPIEAYEKHLVAILAGRRIDVNYLKEHRGIFQEGIDSLLKKGVIEKDGTFIELSRNSWEGFESGLKDLQARLFEKPEAPL